MIGGRKLNNIRKITVSLLLALAVMSGVLYKPISVFADTEDKVFLLSEKEATRTAYGWGNYQSETKRVRKATDWALANYAHQSTSEGQGSELWLRSPAGSSGAGLRYVSVNGSTSNTYQVIQPLSVVPAICIDVP